VTIVVDLDAANSVFHDVVERVRQMDYEPAMIGLLEVIADGEREAFNAGANPTTGERWVPNASSTIARKGHGIPLFESGALEESLIGVGNPGNIHETSHRGLLFGTEIPYSIFNQGGTDRIPARPHVGMNPALPQVLAEEIGDFIVEQLNSGN